MYQIRCFDKIQDVAPNTSVVNSNTTTYSGNFFNYAMSSQYPNFGEADLFNKPKIESKSQVQVTTEASVVVEGVTVTVSQTESKDVKTGSKESQSKVVVGAGDNGVFVAKTTTDGNSTNSAGVQGEVTIPVSTTNRVKFQGSISIED